jgi:hypothetical protein
MESRRTRSHGKRTLSQNQSSSKGTTLEEKKEEEEEARALVKRQSSSNQKAAEPLSLGGSSAHPMFLGAWATPEQLAAIKDLMNPPVVSRHPSFYGTLPKYGVRKEFGAVISPSLLGAAETLAETNHPFYAEQACALAERLPHSVVCNMAAGAM